MREPRLAAGTLVEMVWLIAFIVMFAAVSQEIGRETTTRPATAEAQWHASVDESHEIDPDAWENPSREDAFARLLRADVFAGTVVGSVGATPPHVFALRRLMQEDNSREIFVSLAERGTTAGRLYASVALGRLAPEQAAQLREELLQRGGHVETLVGCFMMEEAVADVLHEIDANKAILGRNSLLDGGRRRPTTQPAE